MAQDEGTLPITARSFGSWNREQDGAEHPGTSAVSAIDVLAAASVDLYINAECNLQCRSCFLGDAYFTGQRMSDTTVESILGWGRSNGISDVAILGGEPTLHPKLSEILLTAARLQYSRIRLVTNGSAPFRRFLESPGADAVTLYYISLDGVSASTHDAIRGRHSFAGAIRSMELLAQAERPFIVTFTVTNLSLPEIGAAVKLAEATGAQSLNVHWMSSMGRAVDAALAVTPREWSTVCQELASMVPVRDDFTVKYQTAFVLRDSSEHDASTSSRYCAVRSRSNLQFMPDGRVHLCGLTVDDPSAAGLEWNGSGVRRRVGETEITVCDTYTGLGCPIRSTRAREPQPLDGEWVPVCIYDRQSVQAGPYLGAATQNEGTTSNGSN